MDLKLLHQTCEFFGLGDPLEIEPVTQGLANRNFIVTTGKGQYVVKDALIHTPQEIEQEIAYLERLKLHEFPAPLYLKSVNGSYFYCPDGHTFVVQEKVTGEHPQADPQVCREVGSALARLHQIPYAGLPGTQNWMNRDYMPGMLEQLREASLEYAPNAFRSYDKFRGLDLTHLPQAIVHNDIYPGNLLFDGSVLKAFLDWEEVGIDAAVIDMGHAVYGLCLREGRVNEANFTALLEGYSVVKSLQEQELRFLPRAIQYVALTNSIWVLVQFGILTPDIEKLAWASAYWQYNLDDLELPKWERPIRKR